VLLGALSVLPASGCLTTSADKATSPAHQGAERSLDTRAELSVQEAAKVQLKLAEDFDRNGRDAEAVVYYEKARAADSHLQGRIGRRLAVLYDRLGNTQQAQAEYKKALKAKPRDADLLVDFGYFYYTRGQWKEAEEQLRAALAVNSKHARAWVNRGLTLAQQNRYDDSVAASEHAVSKAEAQSNLAFILMTQGKRDEARRAYYQALALDPELPIARKALAKLESPPSAPATPRTAEAAREADQRRLTATHEPPLAGASLGWLEESRRRGPDEPRLVPTPVEPQTIDE